MKRHHGQDRLIKSNIIITGIDEKRESPKDERGEDHEVSTAGL